MDEALLRKQEELYERLLSSCVNYKKSPKERLVSSYIQSRLEILEKSWLQFDETHFELASAIDKKVRSEHKYFTDDVYSQYEEHYLEYKTKLIEDLEVRKLPQLPLQQHENAESSGECSKNIEVKLPRIELPKFSGSYEDWQSFYDMFISLIHKNEKLSSVQKLHYLKSSLSGEPEELLKNLSITEANYDTAWEQLLLRYKNKRYNCNEVMKRLFSQKTITTESSSAIKQLLDTTSACLKNLNNMDIETSTWDTIVSYLVVTKLDTESRKLWELQVSQWSESKLPTWEQLTKFLESRFRTLEMLDGVKIIQKTNTNTNKNVQPIKQKSFHSTTYEEKKSNNTCVMCAAQHPLYQCKQFEKLTPEKRSEIVQSKRLCFNCFAPTHSVKGCRQSACCRRCGRRHHTLLHYERVYQGPSSGGTFIPENQQDKQSNQQSGEKSESRVVAHLATENHQSNQSRVLLATALVSIKSTNGYSQIIRALIDQGSEASFVTEATAQSLNLKRVTVNASISGVGDGQTRAKNMVSFNIESLHNPEFSVLVHAFVMRKLTSFLPSGKTSILNWPEIENLPLADPKYGSPERIDVILGADVYSEILNEGVLKHPFENSPVAQSTQLGWILSGRVENDSTNENRVINLHIHVKEDEILKQFWEIERDPTLSVLMDDLEK